MKYLKSLLIISLICLIVLAEGIIPCSRHSLARLVRSNTSLQNEWLNIDEAQRSFIIERIATRFPRLEVSDLKLLDSLIESGDFKGNISPLTIEEAMEKIEQLDKLNEQIFNTDFKPLKIRFVFDKNITDKDLLANIDLDTGILTFKVPTEIMFSSDWFLYDIFYSYIHEDGHIKTCLINYPRGRVGLPFDNTYWFSALATGELNSPFLVLSDFKKDFGSYLVKEEGMFTNLDRMTARILLFQQIQETLNDKLLYLIHGDYYGQAFINMYSDSYEYILYNPENLEYKLINAQEGIDVKDAILLLMRNLNRQVSSRIFGNQVLSDNFQELAEIIIGRINAPYLTKKFFLQEYNSLVKDFIDLTESLSLNYNFQLQLYDYINDFKELWELMIPSSLIP